MIGRRALLAAAALAPLPARALQCVVPAKAGGGFDVTCRLAALALAPRPLPPLYQPGGIGALVFNQVVRGQRPAGPELIAFSTGTLLNLAQGRFGRHGPQAVQWIATLALDHGVVAVHQDAPWRRLPDLLQALAAQPSAIVFAAGGTIGSQDWMKAALLARAAGVGHKLVRVVAFEGGGDAVQALRGRHVQVLAGDAAEIIEQRRAGMPLRVLAVLAERRLPGALADAPTAREQGVDLVWPILRGVYAGPALPAAEAASLGQQLLAGQQRPDYAAELRRLGLLPLPLAGAALDEEVRHQWARHRREAEAFGLK